MLYRNSFAPIVVPLFAAIALGVMRRRDLALIRRFRDAGALDESSAKARSVIGSESERAWSRLERHGMLKTTAADLVWFDEAAWDALSSRRRLYAARAILVVMIVGVAAFLVARQ